MAFQTDEIVKIIERQPGINEAELADAANISVDEMKWAITDMIANGQIIVERASALENIPGKKPLNTYKMADGVTKNVRPDVGLSKVQIGLMALDKAGKKGLTDEELREAMGVHNVRAYLSLQLSRGQVTIGGAGAVKRWYLGSQDQADIVKNVLNPKKSVSVVKDEDGKQPPIAKAEPTPEPAPAPAAEPKPAAKAAKPARTPDPVNVPVFTGSKDFRCAIWSDDGSMTIMRGSELVATLSKQELATLANYYMKHNQGN